MAIGAPSVDDTAISFSIQFFSFSEMGIVKWLAVSNARKAKLKQEKSTSAFGIRAFSLYPDLSVPTSHTTLPFPDDDIFIANECFTVLFVKCGMPQLSSTVLTA